MVYEEGRRREGASNEYKVGSQEVMLPESFTAASADVSFEAADEATSVPSSCEGVRYGIRLLLYRMGLWTTKIRRNQSMVARTPLSLCCRGYLTSAVHDDETVMLKDHTWLRHDYLTLWSSMRSFFT